MRELPRDKGKILEMFRRYDFRMEAGNVKLENCTEFQALVDAYCKKEPEKGEHFIIRHGTPETPPQEAYKCPDCGQYVLNFNLQEYNLPPEMQTVGNYSRLCSDAFNLPNVPTFYCHKCGSEWQWVPELPEEPKPGTPVTPEVKIVAMSDDDKKKSFFDKIMEYFGI